MNHIGSAEKTEPQERATNNTVSSSTHSAKEDDGEEDDVLGPLRSEIDTDFVAPQSYSAQSSTKAGVLSSTGEWRFPNVGAASEEQNNYSGTAAGTADYYGATSWAEEGQGFDDDDGFGDEYDEDEYYYGDYGDDRGNKNYSTSSPPPPAAAGLIAQPIPESLSTKNRGKKSWRKILLGLVFSFVIFGSGYLSYYYYHKYCAVAVKKPPTTGETKGGRKGGSEDGETKGGEISRERTGGKEVQVNADEEEDEDEMGFAKEEDSAKEEVEKSVETQPEEVEPSREIARMKKGRATGLRQPEEVEAELAAEKEKMLVNTSGTTNIATPGNAESPENVHSFLLEFSAVLLVLLHWTGCAKKFFFLFGAGEEEGEGDSSSSSSSDAVSKKEKTGKDAAPSENSIWSTLNRNFGKLACFLTELFACAAPCLKGVVYCLRRKKCVPPPMGDTRTSWAEVLDKRADCLEKFARSRYERADFLGGFFGNVIEWFARILRDGDEGTSDGSRTSFQETAVSSSSASAASAGGKPNDSGGNTKFSSNNAASSTGSIQEPDNTATSREEAGEETREAADSTAASREDVEEQEEEPPAENDPWPWEVDDESESIAAVDNADADADAKPQDEAEDGEDVERSRGPDISEGTSGGKDDDDDDVEGITTTADVGEKMNKKNPHEHSSSNSEHRGERQHPEHHHEEHPGQQHENQNHGQHLLRGTAKTKGPE